MKALASPIAILDGNSLPLEADAAESDNAAPGEGFDALLALVNAQATKGVQPVKVLAPSVGVQSGPSENANAAELQGAQVGKGTQPTPAAKRADVGPTQAFFPWPNVELPSVEGAAKPDACVEPEGVAEPALTGDTKPASRGVVAPSLALAAEEPTAPVTARVTPKLDAKDAGKGGPTRKPSVREGEAAKGAEDVTPSPLAGQAAQSLLTPAQTAPAVVAPSVTSTKRELASAQPTAALAASAPSTPSTAKPDAQGDLNAAAPGFDDLLASAGDAQMSAPTRAAQPTSAPQATIPMSNKETGAVVTKIEFFESSPSGEAKEPIAVDAKLELAHKVSDETSAQSASLESEAESENGTSSEPEPRGEPTAAAPQPRFEVTEGKGMRGLDAVVASLLKPYQDKPEGKSGARVATASAPHISVETGKSQTVRVEERVANVSQALDSAAIKREEEERRGAAREIAEPAVPHFAHHVEIPAEASAPADAAPPAATPVNVPVPLPDPDAAMMGKLARGESLNAAISIEHPELGTMDVLVQNENGRIDVRATLDTPRAAAVLRAHESALRYGVQQAGMTFGALRVNARTGEAKVERSRDVTKRRRERDWEA